MSRGPRLDAPGALHHVIVRGIEGRRIFLTERDREDWVERLAVVAPQTELAVLAWAMLPNHVHLLVRTGKQPLATAMRRLLTGYAGAFNRRHRRIGRLFCNRYKSILVEEEPYLTELVRYIHLNPLRAGIVEDLAGLDAYPWSGHSALLGRGASRPWQAVDEVLNRFDVQRRAALRRYREYVSEGVPRGRRPELQGGGLRRSMGAWKAIPDLRRGREHGLADERILGSGEFVEAVHRELKTEHPPASRSSAAEQLPSLIGRCAAAWGVSVPQLQSGNRRRDVSQARSAAAMLAVRELGLPLTVVAAHLGVTPGAIRHGIARGEQLLRQHMIAPIQATGQRRKVR